MERVPHAETLRQRLAHSAAEETRTWLERLAITVAGLHRAGWYHRDLYLQHFVLRPDASGDDELVLLDVGRARREDRPRRRWFVKDLAALWHSRPGRITRADGLRFVRSWSAAMDEDRRATRAWVEDVLAKAKRIAAHAPRHVDPSRRPRS